MEPIPFNIQNLELIPFNIQTLDSKDVISDSASIPGRWESEDAEVLDAAADIVVVDVLAARRWRCVEDFRVAEEGRHRGVWV